MADAKKGAKRNATVRLGAGRFVRPPTLNARAWYAPWEENTMREHVQGASDEVVAIHEGVLMHELKAEFAASIEMDDPMAGEFPFYDRTGDGEVREVEPDDAGFTARTLSAILRVAQRQDELVLDDVYAEAGIRPSREQALGKVFKQAVAYGWIEQVEKRVWRSLMRPV